MSVQSTILGGLSREPNPVRLTTTSNTDIFTATDDETTVSAFGIANEDTSNATRISVYWYNATNTTSYLIWIGEIAAGEAEIVSDIPQKLKSGDKITATAAAANDLTINVILTRQSRSVPAL